MVAYLRITPNARFARMEERGASAVEYGLLIAGIAALIVVVIFAFGGNFKGIFTNTCSKVTASATTNGLNIAPRTGHASRSREPVT